ncbi:hypothetical protein BWK62_00295 [Flavobacterium oreochromis]|uniref:DUF3575 domain-containing protein n=1 Tax=Flavobacterium columnare TaxID=996 RepID=A0A246GEM4_9FLAO|nr:hypothetical protein BWG23_00275 [Flavobacterium oreochromis]OWP79835.1 hypothetical protein BWK62_00295 [Flavobacterium oreochromis]POR30824.1 hypothetical protein BWK58_00380 [Flavobacterium columnare]
MYFFAINIYSQTTIKGNISTIVGIPQVGIETKIGQKLTFQADVMASLWESVNNAPQKFIIFIPEVRYHFNTLEKGFYIGGHIGGSSYKMQKWNYINSGKYQEGYSLLLGATIGFKVPINNSFSIDLFVGGGSQQGFYKGYYLETGERYETADNFNKSGEWLPYRGGVMICYKLGKK